MPRPLGHIRILLSSRVIFDLEEADKIFAEKGEAEYADYMCGRSAYAADFDAQTMGRKLKPGPLWNFMTAALKLNDVAPGTVEIGMVCKDTTETALPIFRNLDLMNAPVGYRIATAGGALKPVDLTGFDTDLFLSRNAKDTQMAIDNDIAAATINFPSGVSYTRAPGMPVRIWLDGDAVTFGSSAEVIYQEKGLDHYYKSEFNSAANAIEAGPFTKFLAKISQFNAKFPRDQQPFEIALLTARGGDPSVRALTTIKQLGIVFNGGLYFLGGGDKGVVLKAHMPDLFVDDQQVHLKDAQAFCPTGHVAYKTDGPMHKFLQEKAAADAAQKPKDGPKLG